ncbi:hypothetical protein D3870_08590 [Noviherbaspirillum cavernae]|uniref:Uncharacterized protein n=2 Tax=Noviherbaspirillum cavernae TaxID=2320862 RepID=A0A418X0R1_9BURK|nr:hypothetical protein D3870_08590 [Noviherbaspirillum cavernae]
MKEAALPESVLGKLSDMSPGEMRKALLDGMSFAVTAGRNTLIVDDVRFKSDGCKRKIGFRDHQFPPHHFLRIISCALFPAHYFLTSHFRLPRCRHDRSHSIIK